MLKALFQEHKLTILGGIIGGVVGYLYYDYIGCTSGTCPITSNPFIMTVYGTVMGGLLLNLFQKDASKKKIQDN